MDFLTHISSIIKVSKPLEKQILAIAKEVSVPKNQHLLEINTHCTHINFIEKGLVRGYYFDEDKEITSWFASETEFATSLYSFIANKKTKEYIVAVEDCKLMQIAFTDLQQLYANFPETERLGRIITENYYIKLEERLLSLKFKTAKERYQHLEETKSFLLQRATLGQIASYLGITQETLSRIRGEL